MVNSTRRRLLTMSSSDREEPREVLSCAPLRPDEIDEMSHDRRDMRPIRACRAYTLRYHSANTDPLPRQVMKQGKKKVDVGGQKKNPRTSLVREVDKKHDKETKKRSGHKKYQFVPASRDKGGGASSRDTEKEGRKEETKEKNGHKTQLRASRGKGVGARASRDADKEKEEMKKGRDKKKAVPPPCASSRNGSRKGQGQARCSRYSTSTPDKGRGARKTRKKKYHHHDPPLKQAIKKGKEKGTMGAHRKDKKMTERAGKDEKFAPLPPLRACQSEREGREKGRRDKTQTEGKMGAEKGGRDKTCGGGSSREGTSRGSSSTTGAHTEPADSKDSTIGKRKGMENHERREMSVETVAKCTQKTRIAREKKHPEKKTSGKKNIVSTNTPVDAGTQEEAMVTSSGRCSDGGHQMRDGGSPTMTTRNGQVRDRPAADVEEEGKSIIIREAASKRSSGMAQQSLYTRLAQIARSETEEKMLRDGHGMCPKIIYTRACKTKVYQSSFPSLTGKTFQELRQEADEAAQSTEKGKRRVYCRTGGRDKEGRLIRTKGEIIPELFNVPLYDILRATIPPEPSAQRIFEKPESNPVFNHAGVTSFARDLQRKVPLLYQDAYAPINPQFWTHADAQEAHEQRAKEKKSGGAGSSKESEEMTELEILFRQSVQRELERKRKLEQEAKRREDDAARMEYVLSIR